MIKNVIIRKLSVATCSLLIIFMIYLFPKTDDALSIEKNVVYKDTNYDSVYLLDKNDYLAKVDVMVDVKDEINVIKEKLDILVNNKNLNDFISPFPKNTKILDVSITNNILNINFSKELLSCNIENEEAIIESLVYTCIGDNIKGLEIYVEDKLLTKMPSGKKSLSYPLDKSYGINKKYDITSLNNVDKITIYYVGSSNNENYYVPVTHVINNDTEKIIVIIDELKSSVLFQSNLNSYLNSSAVLKDYEIIEQTMFLTFNNKIFDDINSKNILEEVKYTIVQSVKENYNIDDVVFKIVE